MLSSSRTRSAAQLIDVLLAAQIAIWPLAVVGEIWIAAAPTSEVGMMFARGSHILPLFLVALFGGSAIAVLRWLRELQREGVSPNGWLQAGWAAPIAIALIVRPLAAALVPVLMLAWAIALLVGVRRAQRRHEDPLEFVGARPPARKDDRSMTYAGNVESSFISARGRATAITVLVIAQLAALALGTGAYAVGLAQLGIDNVVGGWSIAAGGILSGLDSLLFIAATVVFLTWVYRAIANLPALGSLSCRFSPSDAVWAYFIPFVNLVRGHQVMATIWTESQPAAVDEHGFQMPRRATLVHWWWGLRLVTSFASMITLNSHVVGLDELRSAVQTQMVLHVLLLVDATMFLLMVRGAQKRQEEQWQDLERRRNVPQPSADALR